MGEVLAVSAQHVRSVGTVLLVWGQCGESKKKCGGVLLRCEDSVVEV